MLRIVYKLATVRQKLCWLHPKLECKMFSLLEVKFPILSALPQKEEFSKCKKWGKVSQKQW